MDELCRADSGQHLLKATLAGKLGFRGSNRTSVRRIVTSTCERNGYFLQETYADKIWQPHCTLGRRCCRTCNPDHHGRLRLLPSWTCSVCRQRSPRNPAIQATSTKNAVNLKEFLDNRFGSYFRQDDEQNKAA